MDNEAAYNQALDYLYSFVDYSLKKSTELAKAVFNLDRMRALMVSLGNPEAKFPILHVAGTKGKGSTCALIAAALQAAGYKTGLYTSPHLLDYAERIQIDSQAIPHARLVELVAQVRSHVAAIPELTTFEITTALAFLHFAQQGCEAAVIEVGLGGRLDATNVVTPRVSVITSLSYDHMAVLGNTLTLIAGEKAGIIKPGIPVVSSPQTREAAAVIEQIARERRAPLTVVGKDFLFTEGKQSLDGQALTVGGKREGDSHAESVILRVPLLGRHQVVNAATAYAALKMSGLKISSGAIRKGFAGVTWPCRFEVVRREPPVILDSAHNQDSFEKLDQTLEDLFPRLPVILIFGSSEDKNVEAMLASLGKRLKLILATRAVHPRAIEPEAIIASAERLGLRAEAVTPVQAALERALHLAAEGGGIVLSAGSMFVTAEVKKAWEGMHQ